jgi:DMSO reductase family type II enzyme chaperone
MSQALDTMHSTAADALPLLARAEVYACLSRLIASPQGELAHAWLGHADLLERLQIAAEALPYEFTPAELAAAALGLDPEDPQIVAERVGQSFSALFEVGDRGPPLAIREELAPGANPAGKEEVVRFFEHFGYELGEDYAWRPDHLSVLLEFMHFLTWHDAMATDENLRSGFRNAQRDFLTRHLLWWLGDLSRAVAQRSDSHVLLQTTLSVIHSFIEDEKKWLDASTTVANGG